MLSEYLERIVPFNFKLGNIVLFSRKLDFLVSNQHFHYRAVGRNLEELSEIKLGQKEGVVFWFYPIPHRTPSIFLKNKFICYLPEKSKHYMIHLHQSFDDYFQTRSKKTRATIRKEVKKFDHYCGNAENVRVFRTPEEMQQFYRFGRIVSRNTWQERQIRVGLPKTRKFKEEMSRLAEMDAVRGFILFHGKKPIAFEYLVVDSNHVIVDQYCGYDWKYRAWSPGTVLFHKIQKMIFAENKFIILDLMGGEGEHKRKYANDFIECAHVYCFRKRPIYYVIILTHYFLMKITTLLKFLFHHIGLEEWMKERIRIGVPATLPHRLKGIKNSPDQDSMIK